jgi:hypothetical protein
MQKEDAMERHEKPVSMLMVDDDADDRLMEMVLLGEAWLVNPFYFVEVMKSLAIYWFQIVVLPEVAKGD